MNGSPLEAFSRTLASRLSRRAALPRLGASLLAAASLERSPARTLAQATPTAADGAAGYMVIRRYHLKPDMSPAEVVAAVESGFVPIVREVPGFREYFLAEPGDGTHVSVSVFADQTGAEESTIRATGWAQETLADLVEVPAFEVIGAPLRLNVQAPDTD